MNLLKSKKTVPTLLKAAYILPAEDGDSIIQSLGELPSKYYVEIVGPILKAFELSYRGNVPIHMNPENNVNQELNQEIQKEDE